MSKRAVVLKARHGELVFRWGREAPGEQPDLGSAWGGDGANSADGNLLLSAFASVKIHDSRTLAQELDARGYDLKTLRFSVRRKSR